MLEAHTDLTHRGRAQPGHQLAYKALLNGDIDLYPEYTGILLTERGRASTCPAPADKSTITPLVRRRCGAATTWSCWTPFGLNNTYAVCVPEATGRASMACDEHQRPGPRARAARRR